MCAEKPQARLTLPAVCALGTQEPQPSVEAWNILRYREDYKEQSNSNPHTLPVEAACIALLLPTCTTHLAQHYL